MTYSRLGFIWVLHLSMHLEKYSAFSWLCKASSICPVDNQSFDCMTFVLEVLTVHGSELNLFWAKAFPLL